MKYFVDGFRFPLNIEESKIKNAIRDRLSIGNRSFRYEPCFKKVVFDPNKKKPFLECAFSVETSSYIKDTSISFLPELSSPSYKKLSFPNGVAVTGSSFSALLFSLVLVKQGVKTTLLVPADSLDSKRRLSGSYIYFSKPTGNEEAESMLRELLRDKVGIRGGLVILSSKEHDALISQMIAEFERLGGVLLYKSQPVAISMFLGKIRKLIYMTDKVEKEGKFDRLVMLDQGATGAFYQSIKAKKTKSDARVRVYIESKKKDVDALFYENQLCLPLHFVSRTITSKNGAKVDAHYPMVDCALRNYGPHTAEPIPGLTFVSDKRRVGALTSLEVSLASMEELDSTLASCRRLNLPGCIPCQKVSDFLVRKESFRLGGVRSSYADGIYLDNFHTLLPTAASDALQNCIWKIKEEAPYLSSDALLVGVEPVVRPGEVVIPHRYAQFVKPYWDKQSYTLDLVAQCSFVFDSLKDFFEYA